MRLETQLPVAQAAGLDLYTVADDARRVEGAGYDGLLVEETTHDPFALLALAAQATQDVSLGTAVALAFPRSPLVMARSAWTLQKLSGGRFTLGLGGQVAGQEDPDQSPAGAVSQLREYVHALRMVWWCWQTGGRETFRGEYYLVDLTVALLDAGPIDHPHIPVQLAAVSPAMCTVAGEAADGVRTPPVCTPGYIRDVILPAVRLGALETERPLDSFRVCVKPLVASAPTEAELADKLTDARARLAFSASIPALRAVFEHEGLGALADEAAALHQAQEWSSLTSLIDDETLERFAVVGTDDVIGERLLERFGDVATDIEFSFAVGDEEDDGRLADLADTIRAASDAPARATITGVLPA